MEPILLIMAAGMGSRYGGNKQIDPITDQGDIIMDFSLYDAHQAGFKRVCFVIKEDFAETFRAHIEQGAGKVYDECMYAYQSLTDVPEGYAVPEGRVKPWGTGQAVIAARGCIDAPFVVINADDYYGKSAFRDIYNFLKNDADATHYAMIGFLVRNTLSENGTVTRGICKERDGYLVDIEETFEVGYEREGEFAGQVTGAGADGIKHVIGEDDTVSMNMWGFGKEFMGVLEGKFAAELDRILAVNPMKGEFLLPTTVDDVIKSGVGTVRVLRSHDKWFGVTYKEDKPGVVVKFREMKETGAYPMELWG
ncbi:MAG: nucleotidyltransferase [Mogibacterium sp.]|nr:nucleotidyltransferase [Mogibacterium sp.]